MSSDGEFVESAQEQRATPFPRPPKPSREQMKKMAANIIVLIEASNACPFVHHYDLYRCFYCQDKFHKIKEVREHCDQEHRVPNVKLRLDPMHKGTYVMVDVTGLKCRICSGTTPTLSHLREHLHAAHGLPLNRDVPDGLIPFLLDLDSYNCLVCGHQFQLFKPLSEHMNLHFGDKICEICGTGFLSHGRLKSHKMIHRKTETQAFPCSSCPKSYTSKLACRRHIEHVHEKRPRYRCTMCPESFVDYNTRVTHMHNVHDVEPPEYKCLYCGNGYRRPIIAARHMNVCRARPLDGVGSPKAED